MPLVSGCADLTFHPFAALICYFSEQHYTAFATAPPATQAAQQGGGNPSSALRFLEAQNVFLEICKQRQNRARGGDLPPHMYRPLWLHTFGHADSVALVLLPELHSLPPFTTSSGPIIQLASVGFCPDMEKLLRRSTKDTPFDCTYEELFRSQSDDVDGPLAFQQERPLGLVTKFKLNGIVTLDHAALFQRAVCRAMARRIIQVCRDLKKLAAPRANAEVRAVLSEADVDAYRAFLFALEGSEDLAVVGFGTNFSVAAAVVASLRCLTFGDLLGPETRKDNAGVKADAWDHSLVELLNSGQNKFHRVIVDRWCAREKRPKTKVIPALKDNHLFSYIYSTPGVATHALKHPDRARLRGWVQATHLLNVNPGHGLELYKSCEDNAGGWFSAPSGGQPENALAAEARDQFVTTTVEPSGGQPEDAPAAGSCYPLMIGRHDLALYSGRTDDSKPRMDVKASRLILLRDFILFWKQFNDDLHLTAANAGTCIETGVLNQVASLTVPIPRVDAATAQQHVTLPQGRTDLLLTDVGKEHIPTTALLHEVRVALVEDPVGQAAQGAESEQDVRAGPDKGAATKTEKAQNAETQPLRFVLSDLDAIAEKLGLPWSFRSRLRYLYNNFANALGESILFASVLDLYDALAVLYGIITDDYTAAQQAASECWKEKTLRSVLSDDDILRIDTFLDAIEDAFAHRVARSLPNHDAHDFSADLRGALNKMVLASDSVLKCCMGLVRRLLQVGGTPRQRNTRPTQVAGVACLTFHPNTYLRSEVYGKAPEKTKRMLLARIDMNISHIFCPEELPRYFHETGHLIEKVFDVWKRYADEAPASCCHSELEADRFREIFAELITHLFIFRGDKDLFAKYFIGGFNNRRISTNDTDTIQEFMEYMLRGFVVYYAVSAMAVGDPMADPCDWDDDHPYFGALNRNVEHAVAEFREYIKKFGPYFFEYKRLWSDGKAQGYCLKVFRKLHGTIAAFMPTLWKDALDYYCQYMGDTHPDDGARRLSSLEAALLNQRIDEAISTSAPFLRRSTSPPAAQLPRQSGDVLSALTLVCHLNYTYLQFCYGKLDKRKPLHRIQVDEQANIRGNDFVIDPAHAGLSPTNPDAREQKLRYSIGFVKSLWDLSSELCARRWWDIVKTHF